MRVDVVLSGGMHKMFESIFRSGVKLTNLVMSAILLMVASLPSQAQTSRFAWGCMSTPKTGNRLHIVGSREPGSDIVDVRNSSNEIVLTLRAAGPVTEEVIPNVGRNGEDGIIRKRVYKDADGKRWIYQNLDAHPSFRSTEDSDLVISCFP